MKNLSNRLITTIGIIFVLACGTTQPPLADQDQVETIVAATMQSIATNTPIYTPMNIPTVILTDTPTNTPTNTSTSIPTYTSTPTPVALVVVNVRTVPTPTFPGYIPSGGSAYIEHAEMISCNADTACSSYFWPNGPDYSWSFNSFDSVCILWVEKGRGTGEKLSLTVYQNNQLLAYGSWNVTGSSVCTMSRIPLTALGNYETKLVIGDEEFSLLWSIR